MCQDALKIRNINNVASVSSLFDISQICAIGSFFSKLLYQSQFESDLACNNLNYSGLASKSMAITTSCQDLLSFTPGVAETKGGRGAIPPSQILIVDTLCCISLGRCCLGLETRVIIKISKTHFFPINVD